MRYTLTCEFPHSTGTCTMSTLTEWTSLKNWSSTAAAIGPFWSSRAVSGRITIGVTLTYILPDPLPRDRSPRVPPHPHPSQPESSSSALYRSLFTASTTTFPATSTSGREEARSVSASGLCFLPVFYWPYQGPPLCLTSWALKSSMENCILFMTLER